MEIKVSLKCQASASVGMGWSKFSCLAVAQEKYILVAQVVLFERRGQVLDGLVQGFIREFKSAPMDAQRLTGQDVLVHLHRLLGIDVLVAHEPPGLVGPHGYGRQVKPAKTLANIPGIPGIPHISGKEEPESGLENGPPAPQGPVPVQQGPLRPMLYRHEMKPGSL